MTKPKVRTLIFPEVKAFKVFPLKGKHRGRALVESVSNGTVRPVRFYCKLGLLKALGRASGKDGGGK